MLDSCKVSKRNLKNNWDFIQRGISETKRRVAIDPLRLAWIIEWLSFYQLIISQKIADRLLQRRSLDHTCFLLKHDRSLIWLKIGIPREPLDWWIQEKHSHTLIFTANILSLLLSLALNFVKSIKNTDTLFANKYQSKSKENKYLTERRPPTDRPYARTPPPQRNFTNSRIYPPKTILTEREAYEESQGWILLA